jgi:hypothetical protein
MENAKQEKGEEKKKGFWPSFLTFLISSGLIPRSLLRKAYSL